MRLRELLLAGLVATLVGAAGAAVAQSMSPDQREALDAAEKWLVPVDAGRYQDAWAMASEQLKSLVARDKFRDGLRDIRGKYGKLVSRTGEKMGYVGEPPTPEGELKEGLKVVILFATRFAGDKAATEEMTMVYEKDRIWRAASYYIR
ncbi:MAG: DUF4019 domain-containing protein [Burkholderiales bacterium]